MSDYEVIGRRGNSRWEVVGGPFETSRDARLHIIHLESFEQGWEYRLRERKGGE